MPVAEQTKLCRTCGPKPVIEFVKNTHAKDGLATYCRSCDADRKKQYAAEMKQREQEKRDRPSELVKQIESGEFQVDQKWLLTELVKLYEDTMNKDRLGTLRMIAQISGYDKDTSDDKAIIASLMAGMKKDG